MDHRFSALFFSAPPSSPPSETTMTGALPDPKPAGKKHKASMKHILRKLFSIPKQKQKNDRLITGKILESGLSELSQQVWTESTSVMEDKTVVDKKSAEKKKALGSSSRTGTFVIQPPIQMVRRKDGDTKVGTSMISAITNKKRSSTTSTRDSKFSSITSLPSLAALSFHTHPHTSPSASSGPVITLSVHELATLQSLIRRVERKLKKQEYLTNHLAGNLVHLFGRKEIQIQFLKHSKVQDRERAGREVFRVKENIGREFLRRGVLVGRCEGALNMLRTALDNAARAPITPRRNRRSSSPAHLSSPSSRTSSPSSYKTASKSSINSTASTNPPSNPRFNLSLSTLSDTTYTLTSSLSLQSILNTDLKSQIHSACSTSRWNGLSGGGIGGISKGNVNDRIMMSRFVAFVDSRIGLLEECGHRLEELVRRIEGFGKRVGMD